MKIKLLRYSPLAFIALAGTLLLGSCTKDDEYNNHKGEIESTAGVYVLCEGSFGKNNSDITYYNKNTNVTEKNYYSKVNGKTLGESANDLQRYGSKMYAVVTGLQGSAPSYLEVLDVATCKTIKRISFTASNDGLARGIVFYKNKAYVSRFDGKVSRIDTASLSVDGEITLSGGLDGLAVANGKLYVANSNYYLYPNGKKNVVSVVDINTFIQTKDITVTFNPTRVVAANNGDIYVVCGASYLGVTPTIDRISSITDTKVQSITDYSDFGAIGINGNKALVVTEPYSNAVVRQFDASTNKFGSSFITDTKATIATPYGITFNSFDNSVLVGDANNYNTTGKAVCFDSNGKSISTFETAGNPQRAVFIYNYK